MARRYIDLSHPLCSSTPPFPGDPPVEVEWLDTTKQTDASPRMNLNCSRINLCVHSGTHMDAPFHFYADGATIDRVALDACIGEALRINLPDIGADDAIDANRFEPYRDAIRETGRVLLNTGWYRRWAAADYFTRHPVITGAAAEFLVQCNIRLVGVDFPSVDRPPHDAHLALLGNGVVILENLTDLSRIDHDRFHLIAVPLPIQGGDASPLRVLAQV